MKKKVFVDGMKCENCAKHVKEALMSVNGIINADVNLSEKYVIIDVSNDVSSDAIKIAVNNEKYNVKEIL